MKGTLDTLSILVCIVVLVDYGETFSKEELSLSSGYVADYHNSNEVL